MKFQSRAYVDERLIVEEYKRHQGEGIPNAARDGRKRRQEANGHVDPLCEMPLVFELRYPSIKGGHSMSSSGSDSYRIARWPGAFERGGDM